MPPRNGTADQSLIIVHRKELVEQAAYHCSLAYPDKTVEIEMGNSTASGTADITIASIRSLLSKNRIKKYDPDRFKLVLVDEAHHIVAQSYHQALQHFGLTEKCDRSPVLVGLSATFSRFDGLKLGAAIDHIVYHKDYIDMIGEKWLANAVFTTVQSKANLSGIRKDKFGDFAIGPLSNAVNTKTVNDITVRAWLAKARDRNSTLVFCVDKQHVMHLTTTFREHGVDARYITSSTPKDVRNEQLQAFKDQKYPVLVNCGLFTEGTDIPNVDCIVLARPTRSKNLLIQMIGRGLRLFPEKKDCHIVDMVASLTTGIISTPTLFGLHPDEILDKSNLKQLAEIREARTSVSPGNPSNLSPDEDSKITFTDYDNVYALLSDTKYERHIRSLSPNAWVRVGEYRYVLCESSGWLTIRKNDSGIFAVDYVAKFKGERTSKETYTRPRTIASAPDLEQAVHGADTFASKTFNEYFISTRQTWRSARASDLQIKFLINARIIEESQAVTLTRGLAADMINKLKFGGRKRFAEIETQRRREEAAKREREELNRREEVKVGPLDSL
ncbi:P-loop containing nucleoside triphosphate hydrolase protein [Elaphomyces granulatus]